MLKIAMYEPSIALQNSTGGMEPTEVTMRCRCPRKRWNYCCLNRVVR